MPPSISCLSMCTRSSIEFFVKLSMSYRLPFVLLVLLGSPQDGSSQATQGKTGLAGAPSDVKQGDEVAKAVIEAVRDEIEAQIDEPLGSYIIEGYTVQCVAGQNYRLKIRYGDNKFVHIKVFKSLKNEFELKEVQTGKTLEDPISL